jgi:hypothetical protein
MNDERLSGMARDYVFLCETAIKGPWKIDVFKQDLIREGFARRGEPELFEVAENFIRNAVARPLPVKSVIGK